MTTKLKSISILICIYTVFELAAFCYSGRSLHAQGSTQYPTETKVLEMDVLQVASGFIGKCLGAEVIAVI